MAKRLLRPWKPDPWNVTPSRLADSRHESLWDGLYFYYPLWKAWSIPEDVSPDRRDLLVQGSDTVFLPFGIDAEFGLAKQYERAHEYRDIGTAIAPAEFTICTVARTSSSPEAQIVALTGAGSNSTAPFAWLDFREDDTRFLLRTGDSSTYFNNLGHNVGAGGANGEWQRVVGVGRVGGTCELWVDGIQIATASNTDGGPWTLNNRVGLGAAYFGTSKHNQYIGDIAAAGFSQRAWSPAEIELWTDDPWGLVRQAPRRVYRVPEAGGTTVTLTHLDASPSFGTPELAATITLTLLDASPTFGTIEVADVAADNLDLTHLDASPTFGTPQLASGIALTHLDAAPSFGTPELAGAIHLAALDAAPSFGTPELASAIALAALDASPTFGTPVVGATTIELDHLDASPTFGTLQLADTTVIYGSDYVSEIAGTPTSISKSMDAGTGDDRIAVALCISGDASDHTHGAAPTGDGTTFTQIGATRSFESGESGSLPSNRVVSVWRLEDPTAGSSTYAWDIIDGSTSVAQASMVVVFLQNSGSVDATAFAFDDSGSDDNPTVDLTPNNPDSTLLAFVASEGFNADPYTPGAGMTELRDSSDDDDPTNHTYWAGSTTGSGQQTLSATQDTASSWAMFAVEVTAAFDVIDLDHLDASPSFGTPELASAVHLTALDAAPSFGTPELAATITLTPLDASPSFGTITVTGQVTHTPGPTTVDIDPSTTTAELDPSLTAVDLDPSLTHNTIDADRTTT